MILSLGRATTLARQAMVGVGHSDEEAAVIADHLIDCELRGLGFGGLSRAVSVIERIQATPTTRQEPRIERESAVSAAIDGGDQVGYLVAQRATDLAIAKARSGGLAVVGARNTWYTGMFSYYLEQVTEAGFIGMAAGSGAHIVAPHGGTEARFGTNPLAFGFPTTGTPVIWDIGTSSVMLGEVLLRHREGRPLDAGTAFGPDGQPTQDPVAALFGGAFTVWGGHKGSGLALVVQLLGMACGAAAAPQGVAGCGFMLVVVDPGLLTDADDFRQKAAQYADHVRATRPADEDRPVRVPFDRSAAERDRRRRDSTVEIPEDTYAALINVASSAAGGQS
ncbi:Ldh family oxidoreductase [Streptomyces sp. NPDC056405]|uniref:Ldh family oxidoreductase n=1 Tax=Streptomyces sp. NPDC056405 TaxID=3345811 RepID=UPI0035DAC337